MVNIGGLTECQHGTPGPGSRSSLPDAHSKTHSETQTESEGVPECGT